MTSDHTKHWKYVPDEDPKRKHHWTENHAGFVTVGSAKVGKCPATMSVTDAEALLNDAIPWSPVRWRHDHPQRLYSVLDGVAYRATPTVPGVSYHGFPELPGRFPAGGNASEVKQLLLQRAAEQNCEKEVRAWMNW